MQYENTFKQIDQILWKEPGCSSELDYLEQKSWLLFLKYLDDLETEREEEAELEGKEYKRIITGFNRWSSWAAPKKDGKIDTVNTMTGDDLIGFVDEKLFPYLKHFKDTAAETDTLEYKIGEIFDELHNKIRSGYNMREIINMIDELRFQTDEQKHEMTVLYESNIQRMGNAGRNGGEYYTPRPLIRSIVKVVNPKIGETVYDPACGSAGFLCEAFIHMKEQIQSTDDNTILQKRTFYGREKKGLPYIIATMNMIFHGVAAPNITHGNTLSINLANIEERDRKNVILANPPFGGNERGEVLQNFEIRSSETAYMFMQHFIKMLKAGGRAGIVIKNTFLSNGDASAVRKMLLEECNLHTVLDLPSGVFTGAGVKTVVLFFTKGTPTKRVWYYQVDKHFTKTQPMTEADMDEFLTLQQTKADSEHSWSIDATQLGDDCDLSVKNPNKVEEIDERTPSEIAAELTFIFSEIDKTQKELSKELKESFCNEKKEGWVYSTLGEYCKIYNGNSINAQFKKEHFEGLKEGYPFIATKDVSFNGDVDYENGVRIPFDTDYKTAEPNSVFICVEGGSAGRKIALLKQKVCFGNKLFCLQPKKDVLGTYLYLYLNSNIFQEQFKERLTGLIGGVSAKKFSDIGLIFPPISEQQQIVTYLDTAFEKIDRLKASAQQLLQQCDALKQSLLKEVFE